MMNLVLLTIGIIIAVGVIFIVIRSVIIKLLSLGLLVFVFILIAAIYGGAIKEETNPISFGDDGYIYAYHDNKEFKFKANAVQRVDISKLEGGKVKVSLTFSDRIFNYEFTSIGYEWALKNELFRWFEGRIYDHTK